MLPIKIPINKNNCEFISAIINLKSFVTSVKNLYRLTSIYSYWR